MGHASASSHGCFISTLLICSESDPISGNFKKATPLP